MWTFGLRISFVIRHSSFVILSWVQDRSILMSSRKLLVVLLPVSMALALVYFRRDSSTPIESSGSGISPDVARQIAALEAKERKLDETVWAREILAQECGRTIESLWDSLNAATNKLGLVAAFPVGEMVLGKWKPARYVDRKSVG